MCVILDANAAGEVFQDRSSGRTRPPAGEDFFNAIQDKRVKLVVGGELRRELDRTGFVEWLRSGDQAGRTRFVKDKRVEDKVQELKKEGSCNSNDEHIIALAQISEARLLYTHDKKLIDDFKDENLVSSPGGKIFPTGDSKKAGADRKRLISRTVCPR